MKEDLSLRRSHTASVYPKRPVPDISVNKVAGMQCMYLLSEWSVCIPALGIPYTCYSCNPLQFKLPSRIMSSAH
jgi:hypothetical protein